MLKICGAAFRVMAFGRWLDHDGSNLINGLIQWWIHSLTGYWEVMKALGDGASLEELGHWGCSLGGYTLSLFPSSLSLVPGSFGLPHALCHEVLPHHRARNKSQVTMDWNLETVSQETFLLLNCLPHVFCHGDEQVTIWPWTSCLACSGLNLLTFKTGMVIPHEVQVKITGIIISKIYSEEGLAHIMC
jgi:hypothetical protein